MTIEEWAKDFKSYVKELDMPKDDYKGIIEYIDDAVVLMKKQDELLRKLQKDKDKLCLDVNEWKHKYYDGLMKEQEAKPDKCIICEGCGHKLQDNWNWCPWCRRETVRGKNNTEELRIPYKTMIYPNIEALQKRDEFMSAMEKDVKIEKMDSDGIIAETIVKE